MIKTFKQTNKQTNKQKYFVCTAVLFSSSQLLRQFKQVRAIFKPLIPHHTPGHTCSACSLSLEGMFVFSIIAQVIIEMRAL